MVEIHLVDCEQLDVTSPPLIIDKLLTVESVDRGDLATIDKP